ncbi:MAG: GNAT family N-acetyltransferase [Thermoguttaceae bacterium]
MAEVVVEPVVSRRQRKLFLQYPWKHYAGDPVWIPPLRAYQKEQVGYTRNPFYDRNEIETFLAFRGGEVCGRIAAILNVGHNEYHKENLGFWGFFESIDDQEVADALFDAVRRWFAERGIGHLRGPTNPSLNSEVGLLSPYFMMTYNPPYYERLVEGAGFRKSQDLYAYWGSIDMLPAVLERLTPICLQIIERFEVKVRSLDKSRFREDVEAFLSVYNRAMSNTWGFVPMTKEEVSHQAKGLKQLMVPELAIAAEIEGKIIGACFALLDYNPRIKEIDGRLFPFGFWKLLHNKRGIKRLRLISTNVIPEYQLHGIGLVLMSGIVPKVLEWGIEEAEFSWVLESNSFSRGSLEKGGAKRTKTYRVYDWAAGPPARAS